jgi:hypothetical protein
MVNISNRLRRENQNERFIINKFSFENHAVYETTWKNIVQRDGPQMIWSMCIACWISKTTYKHLESAPLIALYRRNGCTNVPQYYVTHSLFIVFLSMTQRTSRGRLNVRVSTHTTHSQTKDTLQDSSQRAIRSSQTLLLTQRTINTRDDILALCGIGTHDPNNQTASAVRLIRLCERYRRRNDLVNTISP